MYKNIFLVFLASFLITSCAGIRFVGTPLPDSGLNKNTPLTEAERRYWHHMDLQKDSVPGMSVTRAYEELIKDRKGKTVVVAVVDSGIFIEHPSLASSLWVNEDEIPNNGIDDDQNGYVDDVHGWNFLGDSDKENLEHIRLLRKESLGTEAYEKYTREMESGIKSTEEQMGEIYFLLQEFSKADSLLTEALSKKQYSLEEAEEAGKRSVKLFQAANMMAFFKENDLTEKKLSDYLEDLNTQIEAHQNPEFDGRAVVGDDPDDINDRDYGNPNVVGPSTKSTLHGTHVGGIIAAQYGSGSDAKGVAKNVRIMVLRTVPDGDEYDKDVALAIRYAADNGAKIINTSFGKSYSPHTEWVSDALRHAAAKDVLVVNAAGNSGANVDPGEKKSFMTDFIDGKEIVDNFLTVGATTLSYDSGQLASFSNYGAVNVDVFAPGEGIWSSIPEKEFEFNDGTSMAAPNVTGVAAILRSFFPKRTAREIKRILMDSGVPLHNPVFVQKEERYAHPQQISKSGKMVNLYNALLHASSKKSKK